jgi:hypothetical protein
MGRMMFLLRMLTRKRARTMDPLQVSMTGVRMGERFLLIECHDPSLLSGLAMKVGLSGTAAVAAFSDDEARRAADVGRKVGALIEVERLDGGRPWPYADELFDMVVIDDTRDTFGESRGSATVLLHAWRALRKGGRIELITRSKDTGGRADPIDALTQAGFKPARLLAERDGLRFIEGLKGN